MELFGSLPLQAAGMDFSVQGCFSSGIFVGLRSTKTQTGELRCNSIVTS